MQGSNDVGGLWQNISYLCISWTANSINQPKLNTKCQMVNSSKNFVHKEKFNKTLTHIYIQCIRTHNCYKNNNNDSSSKNSNSNIWYKWYKLYSTQIK